MEEWERGGHLGGRRKGGGGALNTNYGVQKRSLRQENLHKLQYVQPSLSVGKKARL